MTTRSNQIARRWFWIVGLLVAVFVTGVAAVLLWPADGRLVAVSDVASAEADAEPGGEGNGPAGNGASDDGASGSGAPDAQEAPNPDEVDDGGWFSSSQASAGGEAYAEHCAQCHGNALEGGTGPALAGDTFWQRWGGESVHVFYEVSRQTMPQGAPGSLPAETYADITAHVLATNDFPAGESALPPEPDHLQTLVIERAATGDDGPIGARDDPAGDTQESARARDANGEQQAGAGAAGDTRTVADTRADADANADGWFSESQVRAGEADFAQHCARCHGAGLQGDPPLLGGGFPERWTSVWELYQYVRQTMPLDAPGLLDDRTYVDTVAYMLNENGYPTGDRRLASGRIHMTAMEFDPSLAVAPRDEDRAETGRDDAARDDADRDDADRDDADRDEADRDEADRDDADRDEADRDDADRDEADRDEAEADAADADANGPDEAVGEETTDANGNEASTAGWFTDDQAERGSEPYAQHCATCHGNDLSGSPPLSGEQFLARYETVWDVFDYTRTQMPQDAPGSLDDATYADITAFVLRGNDFPAGDEELDAADEDGMRDMQLGAADADGGDAADGDAADGDAQDDTAARERPELGRAWLVLDTRPTNVTINVIGPDGFTGRAIGGQTLQDLRPGLYVIAASRGHQSVMTTVVLGSGETSTLTLVLDELSRSGDVSTTPGTGEAEIPAIPRRPADGALIGEAPGATPTATTMVGARDADRDRDQETQSERGQHAYALHCARCHGVQLEGNVAPALGGDVFLERWQGHPVDWLYFQARGSMPPHAPGILSEQTYADIIAFALREAGIIDGHERFRPNDEAFRMLTIAPRGGLDDRPALEDRVGRLREALHGPQDGVTLDIWKPLRPIEWPDDAGTAPVGDPGRIDAAAATAGAFWDRAPDEDAEGGENGAEGADADRDQDDRDDDGEVDEEGDADDANALPAARPSPGTH